MTAPRNPYLTERLVALLERMSPPRSIAANLGAQQGEVAALVRAILAAAPSQGYADWWAKFEDALLCRLKTRAWPIISEVHAAARDIAGEARGQRHSKESNTIENAAINRMADWFGKFQNQMPGHGKVSQTQALIASGVLRDEREAQFRGFDLSPEMAARAKELAPSAVEAVHHQRVLDSLRDIHEQIEKNKASWQSERGAE